MSFNHTIIQCVSLNPIGHCVRSVSRSDAFYSASDEKSDEHKPECRSSPWQEKRRNALCYIWRNSLEAFLRYTVQRNCTGVRSQQPWPFTSDHHSLISLSFGPHKWFCHIWRNFLEVLLRYCVRQTDYLNTPVTSLDLNKDGHHVSISCHWTKTMPRYLIRVLPSFADDTIWHLLLCRI